jgi:ankyrin repeat protein
MMRCCLAIPVLALCFAAAVTLAQAEETLLPDTRLPEAVKRGDKAEVEALLHAHVPVNSAEGDGTTSLHWAVYNNNLDIARILLDAHANANATTRLEGFTPLYMASQNGAASMIELLLKHGANANGANELGTTPLMMAAASGSVDAVKELVDGGANVNAHENVREQTALMFAANQNRDAVIKFLVAHGADPNIESKVYPPFHMPRSGMPVADAGKAKTIAGANTAKPATAASGESADPDADEEDAADASKTVPANAPASGPAYGGPTGSSISGGSANPKAAAKAAQPMARDYGAKMLGGLSPLLYAARQGNIEATVALLDGGAKIDEASGSEHTTPLVLAIANAHLDLARVLVERGANVNLANDMGLTPLYATIDVKWVPHEWSAEPLVDQEKTDYLTLMKLLVDHGASVNAQLGKGVWERTLSEARIWIDRAGSTAFFRAAEANDLKAMKLLKDADADPNIPTKAGVTPLMAAAGLGWSANYSVTAPARLDAVKYCIGLGGKVNAKDNIGFTALGGAAFVGNLDVIKYLVSQGADLQVKSKNGDTVADMANGLFEKSLPEPEAVALLVSLGVPQPHNCRSSECLPETNAKVRGAASH